LSADVALRPAKARSARAICSIPAVGDGATKTLAWDQDGGTGVFSYTGTTPLVAYLPANRAFRSGPFVGGRLGSPRDLDRSNALTLIDFCGSTVRFSPPPGGISGCRERNG
jgi:hypothetical protein